MSTRPVTYCLVPADLAGRLHEALREHFRDDPGIEVVVEQRGRPERRRRGERREAEGEGPGGVERRTLPGPGDRRIGERRAPLGAVEAPELPRRARRYADRLVFVRRLEPAGERAEDLEAARIVTRFQAGDSEAFGELYTRYFDRIYGYLRVALKDTHEAEDATQQVFAEALEALPRYERRAQPFRAWLFTLARHVAIKHFRRTHRIELPGDEELDRLREAEPAEEIELPALDWITDTDLLIFVERLSPEQRQVLSLRYVLGLRTAEIAEALGRSPEAVRMQQSRAVRFLRDRLAAIGRAPEGKRRPVPSLAPLSPAKVTRIRRFSLTNPGPTR